MIDYLFSFANEAAAKADPVVGAFFRSGSSDSPAAWAGEACIPNIQIQVAATAVAVNANWNIIIAQARPNPALASHANRIAWMDRDTGQVVSPTALFTWKSRAVFPLPMGANRYVGPDFAPQPGATGP